MRQGAKLLSVLNFTPELPATRVVEQERRIRRLERHRTTPNGTHDLPSLAQMLDVQTKRPAVLLLPRDNRKPVRDELEARQSPRKFPGEIPAPLGSGSSKSATALGLHQRLHDLTIKLNWRCFLHRVLRRFISFFGADWINPIGQHYEARIWWGPIEMNKEEAVFPNMQDRTLLLKTGPRTREPHAITRAEF